MQALSSDSSGQGLRRQGLRRTLRRARRRVTFLLMRWLVRCARFERVRALGAWLGIVHYRFGRRTRKRCMAGVAAWLGTDAGDPQVKDTLREAYRTSTIAVLEVLSMIDQRVDNAVLYRRCRVEGTAHLDAARKGRGAILLLNHSGNSLLLAAQLAHAGWPVTVVYRHTPMMSAGFFAEGLPRYGLEAILANEGFRAYARMVDALRRDRVLFAMMDQGVEKAETGLPLQFLGKHMPMPGGVVQLARHCRAPILPVATLAAEPAWRFSIGAPLRLTPGGSIAEDTGEVLRHMEAAIRAHPELWSWPHRRWRNFPVPGR